PANAVDVELLADHVDHAQRDLAQFPAHRAERAAEAQGVDAQPHQFARAGIFHRRVNALVPGRRTDRFDRIVSTAVDDDIGAPAREACSLAGVARVAMTVAPASLASPMVAVPMPPDAPVMRTVSFIRTLSWVVTMRWAVAHGHMAAGALIEVELGP